MFRRSPVDPVHPVIHPRTRQASPVQASSVRASSIQCRSTHAAAHHATGGANRRRRKTRAQRSRAAVARAIWLVREVAQGGVRHCGVVPSGALARTAAHIAAIAVGIAMRRPAPRISARAAATRSLKASTARRKAVWRHPPIRGARALRRQKAVSPHITPTRQQLSGRRLAPRLRPHHRPSTHSGTRIVRAHRGKLASAPARWLR
jgi:hypothetical protein